MWHLMARASGMPRPAKPARQTSHARLVARADFIRNPRSVLSVDGARVGKRRAYFVCRAGFAGGGMPLARATDGTLSRPNPDPRRSLGSA
jgi:hypothetical protein